RRRRQARRRGDLRRRVGRNGVLPPGRDRRPVQLPEQTCRRSRHRTRPGLRGRRRAAPCRPRLSAAHRHARTGRAGVIATRVRGSIVPKAIWNDVVIAESGQTDVVEGNHYFPPESLSREHFRESQTTSVCPWKGTALYCTVMFGGRKNVAAGWCYPTPKPAAPTSPERSPSG